MALDFQRPDPSSPAAVASAQFTVTRRGYREEEVRDFLRQVSVEMARLLERERFLENELKALQARGPIDVTTIDEAAITELLGAEAARVLSAAREAAQAMRDRAAESAEQVVKDASREAARMLEESTLEASRRRSDVSTEAEQEIELAKQQGREMVAEVRAYRERVLADMAKRTEEARRELEHLVHERERLLTAFERARHAATDVVGDLTEFDEAIRGTGIVPPLVPPDAPPPPRPTRTTDTPIFDAKQYQDELGGARQADDEVATSDGHTAVGDETVPTIDAPEAKGDEESQVETTTRAAVDDDVADTPAASSPVANTPAASTSDRGTEHIAEVVSIFDRKRKSEARKSERPVSGAGATDEMTDEMTDDATETESTADETSSAAAPIGRAPEHPTFERVVAQPDVPVTPPTPSRVDEIFERLRASSPQKVARETKQDLTTVKAGSLGKATPTKQPEATDKVTPPSTPEPTGKAVRPRPVDPAVFRRRDEVVTAATPNISRALKRVLADDENALLTHIGTKRSTLTVAAMLPTPPDHAQRCIDLVRDDVLSVAVDAARSLTESRRSDVRKSVTSGGVLESVRDFIVNDMIRPLHDRIATAVDHA
ncbi:MAG: DivIVA domain-containing protein, partial [Actinobacteria bacterium]|nr:DivIVA domain-containing protein [Actinomycetota bacterium]